MIYGVTEPRAHQRLLSAPVSAAPLISVLSCAWEHSDKSCGHALGPGTGIALVLGGLSCGEARDYISLFPSRTDMAVFVRQLQRPLHVLF